jgi:beta-lactamase class A
MTTLEDGLSSSWRLLLTTINDVIAEIDGSVGVAAEHFERGDKISHDPDGVYFTASTFKVPLLVELYRQVDAGKLDLQRRVELTDGLRVPGSGVLRELGVGIQPTLYDLALLMIIVSDNLATDILYHTVGRDNLNATMERLGLANTRLPMSCRELLFSLAGETDVDDSLDSFQRVGDAVEAGYRGLSPNCDALNEDLSDVSSPNDMIRLLGMVYKQELLSADSSDSVLHILKRQKLNSIIPFYLPPGTIVAHKTGGVKSVRCDVGIVWSPTGPYSVAIMAKKIGDATDLDSKLARISRLIYDEMTAS